MGFAGGARRLSSGCLGGLQFTAAKPAVWMKLIYKMYFDSAIRNVYKLTLGKLTFCILLNYFFDMVFCYAQKNIKGDV